MLVLHLTWLEDRLLSWAECSDVPSSTGSRKARSSRKAKTTAPDLPFGAATATLTDALKQILPNLQQSDYAQENVVLWLPTAQKQPLASTPLIAEPPLTSKGVTLEPWQVTGLTLSPSLAIQILCQAMSDRVLQPGVIVGTTLAFWALVLRFAGSLVAREQFLPGMDSTGSQPRAVWEPILTPDALTREAQLARSMPGACRAASRNVEASPNVPAALVIRRFVQKMVDELVRSSIAPPSEAPSSGRKTRAKSKSFDSVHDQWIHALRSTESTLAGESEKQSELVAQIEDWRRPITVATSSPFRLMFRLEEPEETSTGKGRTKQNEHWILRYLLQSVNDLSLLVPVKEAWKKRISKKSVLNVPDFHPREYLLTTLGEASSIYPPIEESLKSASPEAALLDVHQAHAFLTQHAGELQQAGFGVLLPAWWSRKGTKQRLTLRAKAKSRKSQPGSGISLNTLVTFDWQVALGDEMLTLEELEELARLKAPLVKVRGQWAQLTAEEIEAAINFWKSKGEVPLRELVQMALGKAQATEGLAFEGVHATGWIGDFLGQLQSGTELEPVKASEHFQGSLRPYQERGYSWLTFLSHWGLGACLADDMGLGKTIQTLAWIQREWDSDPRPSLLICPMSVVGNWQKEAERFTPNLPVMVHHGQKRIKGKTFRSVAQDHALVLSSYSLLHRDFELLQSLSWHAVILDEAQNVKNPETKQARAARSLKSDCRIALTGTPVENHMGDLWSIMEFLNPGFLGSFADFRRRFLVPVQANNDLEASEKLKRLTGPFVLRRLKTDKSIIADLPEKIESKVYCNLTREQATLYAGVVEEANQSLEESESGIQRRGTILAILSKLKQVCNHPRQLLGDNSPIAGRSGKLARLTEMIEEILEVGDRA